MKASEKMNDETNPHKIKDDVMRQFDACEIMLTDPVFRDQSTIKEPVEVLRLLRAYVERVFSNMETQPNTLELLGIDKAPALTHPKTLLCKPEDLDPLMKLAVSLFNPPLEERKPVMDLVTNLFREIGTCFHRGGVCEFDETIELNFKRGCFVGMRSKPERNNAGSVFSLLTLD